MRENYINLTIKLLGIQDDNKKSYNYQITTLGTVTIKNGRFKEFKMNKFFEHVNKNNMRQTRLAKYQPIFNIIQLVFLTQLFVIDQLKATKRFTTNSKLLRAVRSLNEEANPLENINALLKDIARKTQDPIKVQLEPVWGEKGTLQEVTFMGGGKKVFQPLSLKTQFDDRLYKDKSQKLEDIIAEMNPYTSDFYRDTIENIEETSK